MFETDYATLKEVLTEEEFDDVLLKMYYLLNDSENYGNEYWSMKTIIKHFETGDFDIKIEQSNDVWVYGMYVTTITKEQREELIKNRKELYPDEFYSYQNGEEIDDKQINSWLFEVMDDINLNQSLFHSEHQVIHL